VPTAVASDSHDGVAVTAWPRTKNAPAHARAPVHRSPSRHQESAQEAKRRPQAVGARDETSVHKVVRGSAVRCRDAPIEAHSNTEVTPSPAAAAPYGPRRLRQARTEELRGSPTRICQQYFQDMPAVLPGYPSSAFKMQDGGSSEGCQSANHTAC